MALGPLYGSRIGPPTTLSQVQINGNTSFAMAGLNTGWCARFTARSTKDVKAIKVRWAGVSVAGVYSVQVEGITASTGKPNGTPYDAAAIILGQVPVDSTVVTSTFAVLPTAGLVAGTEYGVVLLTTTGGTTNSLRSHPAQAAIASTYPTVVLTAADGTTRTNFAEVAGAVPIVAIVLEDDTEEILGLNSFGGTAQQSLITDGSGLRGGAMKFTLASSVQVAAYEFFPSPQGTPPSGSNLRCRILDSGNTLVTDSTVTLDYDSLIAGAGRTVIAPIASPVTLAAGTYRFVIDEPAGASTSTSNCWRLNANVVLDGSVYYPSGILFSTAPNMASPSWTDQATQTPAMALVLNDIPSAGGSGGGLRLAGHGGLAA